MREASGGQRGSAMLLAVFVLVLLTGMALHLLFLARLELRMSVADSRGKRAYYLAEAGAEAGRQALFNANVGGPFDDDLSAHAGPDTIIDFDPATVLPVYDGQGRLTGLTGFDDDTALLPVTQFGDGWYAAFLTNDPADAGGIAATADGNDRVMITGVGAGGDGSFEVVQAIVEKNPVFPGEIPATLTMFGPNPSFTDANDAAKVFNGDDCTTPGFSVPVAGLIGTPAESVVEGSLSTDTVYTSAGNSDDVTVSDLTDPTDPGIAASSLGLIDPAWIDCQQLRSMTEEVRVVADVVCTEGSPCALPASAPDRIVFADGDFSLAAADTGAGTLWVTGTLTMEAAAEWNGLIVVIGEGAFVRSGVGNGRISGATVLAHIAGPDNTYGTADDCTGGNAGFDRASFDEIAGATGETRYCRSDILAATPYTRYDVVEFRQR